MNKPATAGHDYDDDDGCEDGCDGSGDGGDEVHKGHALNYSLYLQCKERKAKVIC